MSKETKKEETFMDYYRTMVSALFCKGLGRLTGDEETGDRLAKEIIDESNKKYKK